MNKLKLNILEQVEYMRDELGIKFNIVNEDDARKFLTNNTYFFKIKSYAKNYDKTPGLKGKYKELEFAYLLELSIIDMLFRQVILQITLNVEHALKTKLMKDFAYNDLEDGYNIVNQFLNRNEVITQKLMKYKSNSVTEPIIEKYNDKYAFWNLIEVLQFGDFIKLYNFYYNYYNKTNSIKSWLHCVRILRNAAAHNNCLIHTLKTSLNPSFRKNINISNKLELIKTVSKKIRTSKMKNAIVHDVVVTLFTLDEISKSKAIKYQSFVGLQNLMNGRMVRNKGYFDKNDMIKSHYNFLKNVIDYFVEKNI